MNRLLLLVAILATLSRSDGAQSKQLGPCEGVTNIRDFSHCIKKRQACNQNCNSCNNCDDCDNDCASCQDCQQYGGGGNYQTGSNNQNNVDIQNSQTNENPHQNKITVNLLNTVHNLNKINNPIEIDNHNHFSYDQKSSQSVNSQGNSTLVEVGGFGTWRRPQEQPNWQPSCCGAGDGFCGTRTPMLLPPYIPPPPPCYYMPQMPYFSCNIAPAPVIVPACAPCFYCSGKYNPIECSKKKECKEGCKKLLCGNAPCYPQIQSCDKDKDQKDDDMLNVDKDIK